ncbi:hypothetical protein SPRG_05110 [Saprolegnia parasitica CBS 223.65]|uniref:F-box domain-containing protein n=1 Tax=Saprolegnia parasitica (strain CBS 223.65) TaxID=695850 RepID=A0A067CI26_SAPPC|nr:hypothetical protein SPRG_05110 [Saprolegnia parasitica CBS 223.65]KDO30399.1 hypothetical protein SPRG_05110 [Saprolegnia parasitica CBS 223.65]|eukprot:XP_012199009.1 hypothetical protein SPRG_05110 [Saprolegnia parasitica CBS 223.65]
MTKRAKADTGRWLLPPVVLHVAHYLDETIDVLAFLHAMPSDARDEALDACVTLLTRAYDNFLWSDTEVCTLAKMDQATVIQALPAFHKLMVVEEAQVVAFCRRTPCPPMANVRAAVDNVQGLQSKFGTWVPSITELCIHVERTPLDRRVLERELSSCATLQELNIQWDEAPLDQVQLDDVMAAVAASCPHLAILCLNSKTIANLQCCKSLFRWLSQPTARRFKLYEIDFAPRAAKTLAHALLASTTLHTIKLFRASSVINAFLDPSSQPLPNQLRNLALEFGSSSFDAPT